MNSLGSKLERLILAARACREHAYAPYSRFQVGAAVQAPGGRIAAGCNVENASYGLTICAERVAASQLVASGERLIIALAIVVDADRPTPPCGACLQFLAEFVSSAELPIVIEDLAGGRCFYRFGDLMPHPFRLGRASTSPGS